MLTADNFLDNIHASPILIVDDNPINRIFIEKTLQANGYNRLLSVASSEEALEKIILFNPDLIVLDIMMPGMDGFDCCRAIHSQPDYRDLPILIQTTLTEPELRVKAFAMGAADFISKPIYPEELCARVAVHLEKRLLLKNLQLYKNRMELELESARQLQQAILPGASEISYIEKICNLDIASHFRPSSEIGGDFWGMKNLFAHQTAFWMVDFSGHGVAAALNSFRLQAYLKEHSSLAARPGEYLSHLNDKLLHLLLRGQFATMFYGIIDTQSNQLFYACACSTHPIILRKATGKSQFIDGSGNPLGIGMHMYPTNTIPFMAGDLLLLYSDALTETANPKGEYITEKIIKEILDKYKDESANHIKNAILDYLKLHAGDKLSDDLTIAICKRSSSINYNK